MTQYSNEAYIEQAIDKLAEIEMFIEMLPDEVSHWAANLNDDVDTENMISSVIDELEAAAARLKSMLGHKSTENTNGA